MQNQISKKLSPNRAAAVVKKKMDRIVQAEGRRPRILLAHLETNQPDTWTKPLAAALAEFGFDVDIGPEHQTPLQAARLAIDNDVHLVCVSITDSANQSMVVQLAEALESENGSDIRLVAGGTILASNSDILNRADVNLIVNFVPPDSNLAKRLLDLLS